MSTELNNHVNSLRYTWNKMKKDDSYSKAIALTYKSTAGMLFVPVLLIVFMIYHKLYEIYEVRVITYAGISLITLVVIVAFYTWVSKTIT